MELNDYYKRKSKRSIKLLSTMFDLALYSILLSLIWWGLRLL